MSTKIRFGTHAPGNLGADTLVDALRQREVLGFYSTNYADHLMGMLPQSVWTPDIAPAAASVRSPHIRFDIVAAMAAASMVTSTLRLVASVTDVLRRHPAMLAQEFLTLDHLSKGRAILGLGSGELMNLEPYGVEHSKPVSRLEEAIQIIRLLWSTDQPVDFEGQFWRLHTAVEGLQPYGPQPPPIWLGAMGPRMLELCGKYCDGWLPLYLPPEEYGRRLATIKRVAVQHGRDMSSFAASMETFAVIAGSHEECHRLLDMPLMKIFCLVADAEIWARHNAVHPFGHRQPLQDYIPTRWTRQQVLDAMARVPSEVVHDYLVHGTPDELCELFEAYAAQGMTHAQLNNHTPSVDPSLAASSFEGMVQIVQHFR